MAVVKSGHTDGGENEKSHDEFVLQTVLALQHVWRVGMATGVTFFCYGTAFLARCGLDLASRYAKLAGAAWRQLHLLPDAQASDDEDEEDMDPWDARNRRGFESMEGHRDVRTLPQWDLLETQSQGFSRSVSPFWASVVEELPRGVDVEWLPGMGLAGQHASICGDLGEGGFVHQIRIDETTVMVTILVRHDSSIRSLSALDMKTQALVREAIGPRSLLAPKLLTRHVDKDILRLPEDLNAIVPCQSIWDDAGQRLAAAVVLEYSM
jgi:diphthine-ammonia ligase